MTMADTSGRGIRRAFLRFFEEQGHRRAHSGSLVPGDDPTLLFTNAGMVQFKDLFTGERQAEHPRATSSQKCLRVSGKHNDLDNVGRTPRHHTFFEMLGNFSFGDYFKAEAIDFAWTFLTAPEWCGLPVERLWASVHHTDDEAYELWRDRIGLPEDRILKLGDKDNFWAMGETGPCGPCSEIHWDRGPEHGDDLEERLLELWNLVFMQFERSADGETKPLPNPSIDTGMGLERIAAVLQGVESNYDTDLLRAIIRRGEEVSGRAYGEDPEIDLALRVIADHSRATAFLIADDILPDNEGRGYVLRRVMRRAIRFGRVLELDQAFFHETCLAVCDLMGDDYPELEQSREAIARSVPREEELFRRTLDRGLQLIGDWRGHQGAGATMDGETAFRLYDTFGFPVDLTRVIGEEQGFSVDAEGFEAALEAQRARGRAAWKGGSGGDGAVHRELFDELGATDFVGYDKLAVDDVPAMALVKGGSRVDSATAGDEVEIVVPSTPFYGEAGGQIGDVGLIRAPGALLQVLDTQRPLAELFVHRARVTEGTLKVGDRLGLEVDGPARTDTTRNHSATHLLHFALRAVLGDHVRQRGSLVEPGRTRFDFSHHQPVTRDEMLRIEALANDMVLVNSATAVKSMGHDAALAEGALAFFGDKYGAEVRTVRLGDDSFELCGGTHVRRSGDIGFIKVLSEGGIQAGVRRIEAVTGRGAMELLQRQDGIVQGAAEMLKATPADTLDRIDRLLRQQKELERQVEDLKRQLATGSAFDLLDQVQDVNGIKVLAVRSDGVAPKQLRDLGDKLRDKLRSGAVMVASEHEGKVALLVVVTKDLTDRLRAGELIRGAAECVSGRGGGRPDLAQAGGSDPGGIDDAIAAFVAAVRGATGG